MTAAIAVSVTSQEVQRLGSGLPLVLLPGHELIGTVLALEMPALEDNLALGEGRRLPETEVEDKKVQSKRVCSA